MGKKFELKIVRRCRSCSLPLLFFLFGRRLFRIYTFLGCVCAESGLRVCMFLFAYLNLKYGGSVCFCEMLTYWEPSLKFIALFWESKYGGCRNRIYCLDCLKFLKLCISVLYSIMRALYRETLYIKSYKVFKGNVT